MKIQIDIPDGMRCVDSHMKRCKLCSYAAHLDAYNCRLYGRLLKGGAGRFPSSARSALPQTA